MDAVATVLVFIGAWLMYEAVKNPTPTPIATAKSQLAAPKA